MPGLQTGLGGLGWYWQISAADTGHAAALQYTGQPQQTTKTVICTAPSSGQWSLVLPGAWVHIMQHAYNHRPATIDANIQLSAWLRSYREFIHLLNVEHHHPRLCVDSTVRRFSNQLFDKHENTVFEEPYERFFFLNDTSCIYHRDMKIRTDRRQLVEVPFSKKCEYQNQRSPVLWHVIFMFQY